MYHHLPRNTIAFSQSLTCIVSDVTVTSFLIPCLSCIIGSLLVWNDLRQGKLITPIDKRWLQLPIFKIVPTGILIYYTTFHPTSHSLDHSLVFIVSRIFFLVSPIIGQTWLDVLKRSLIFGFIGILVFMPITLIGMYLYPLFLTLHIL